jgi:ketosteroid isomerase-like protein
MTTRQTVETYFDRLAQKNGWEASLAEEMVFTRFTSPIRQVQGKHAYLQATQRFYSMIRGVELRQLIVDGDRAVALTRYDLQPPGAAPAFTSDVAEIFSVHNGKIDSFDIYFDSAPFPK